MPSRCQMDVSSARGLEHPCHNRVPREFVVTSSGQWQCFVVDASGRIGMLSIAPMSKDWLAQDCCHDGTLPTPSHGKAEH